MSYKTAVKQILSNPKEILSNQLIADLTNRSIRTAKRYKRAIAEYYSISINNVRNEHAADYYALESGDN